MPNFDSNFMKRFIAHISYLFLIFALPAQVQGQDISQPGALGLETNGVCAGISLNDNNHSDVLSVVESDYVAEKSNLNPTLPPPMANDADGMDFALLSSESRHIRISDHENNSNNTNSSNRRTIMAVKSNLLYDALTLINCSVELPIGDKFSALVYSQFPWWKWGEADNEYCVRFLSLGAEGRWWFAPRPQPATVKRQERDRLVGHFVGVYAESGMWDFQFKRNICRQGEFWSVGVSYGYSMPIGRRLNMEFSLSVGYASIPYRGYTPSTDYEILWRDNENVGCWGYIGPTKVQVSLVVPIKASQKKGGCR